MDFLDELIISDVSTTVQDTLIKECKNGDISDIDEYPVRIDIDAFKKDNDYSHIKEHIYDVLKSFSQYIEYSDAFCIGTALAVVCPLEKYENLMTSIFIPRKRELKTYPHNETNSLFFGNIFK